MIPLVEAAAVVQVEVAAGALCGDAATADSPATRRTSARSTERLQPMASSRVRQRATVMIERVRR